MKKDEQTAHLSHDFYSILIGCVCGYTLVTTLELLWGQSRKLFKLSLEMRLVGV
jgi:hypothetical protein